MRRKRAPDAAARPAPSPFRPSCLLLPCSRSSSSGGSAYAAEAEKAQKAQDREQTFV